MARHPRELLLKEAIHTQMTPADECLNRDTGPGTPGSCWRKPSTSRWPQLTNASTGTQGLSSLDAGWLPWEDRRTQTTEQVQHPLTNCALMVIADDAACRHKIDTLTLRTIFTLKKTGATRLKRRQDFCIHAGIGETVYLTTSCLQGV